LNNETDRAMRDLFAEPYLELGPDEVFVAGVLGRVRRRSRLRAALKGAAAVLLVGAIVFALPVVTDSTSVVASLPFLAIEPFQELLVSPAGLLASLPIGILVLALSTLRLREM
jgi:hypothetical protein